MAADRQACGFAGWPIWRAALLAGAFFIFGGARAEAGSRPGEVTAVAPEAILDRRPADPAPVPRQANTERSMRGNPLWAVPLEALADTRARPIFSPSRRPPSTPIVASPPPPIPKPPPPREPDRVKLTLLGTIIGTSDGIGVFLDETSKVIRIKTGASHDGWTLRSVNRRAASFERNRQETTLTFSPPGSERPASGVGVAASRSGGFNGSGNSAVANPAENRAQPVALTLPVPAPTMPGTHKLRQEIRQDVLSIGVQH
jgi:general secretion pathway protein N